ncbi:MAG: hypothetical protein JWQ07_85 [Ramlibacter sp.]|nr:hypothetical protein [Ramlibacter sp.]
MQIDGHHTATYVAARIAGFSFKDAETVAYAAQYVDDATNAGIVQFSESDYLYSRIASAHKMIDYNNLVDVENHLAWIPFHFLPGNGSMPAGESPAGGEVARLVCRPDSHIARDMLRSAVLDRDRPRGLHRLGIAMHVYADTFAHQGFVGSLSAANQTKNLTSGDPALDARIQAATRNELVATVRAEIKGLIQLVVKAAGIMIRERRWPGSYIAAFLKKTPVGHAAADVYPDQPYLTWSYEDFNGQLIKRDNPALFVQAMDMMVRAMQAWRVGDQTMNLEAQAGMTGADRDVAARLFRELTAIEGEERRQEWLASIGRGEFSFGHEVPTYVGKGTGSWKETALGTIKAKDTGLEHYEYAPAFLTSDWKLFHDALQIHRSDVVHNILPRYGICAA